MNGELLLSPVQVTLLKRAPYKRSFYLYPNNKSRILLKQKSENVFLIILEQFRFRIIFFFYLIGIFYMLLVQILYLNGQDISS